MDVDPVVEQEVVDKAILDGLALDSIVAETRSLAPGQALWFENDLADELGVVVGGELDVLSGRQRVARLSSGQMLGEASVFLDSQLRTATVRARTSSRVLIVTKAQLVVLRTQRPELYGLLLDRALRVIAQRVEDNGRALARLTEGTLPRPRAVPDIPASGTAGLAMSAVEAVLRQLPGLAAADATAVAELSAAVTPRRVRAGTTLVLEGEPGTSLFLVAHGRFCVLRSIGPHTATQVGVLMPGGMLGSGAFLLEHPRNASCVALEDSWALELTRAAYSRLSNKAALALKEALLPSLRDQLVSTTSHHARLLAARALMLGRPDPDDDPTAPLGASLLWPPPYSASAARVQASAEAVLLRLFAHRRLLMGSEPCDEKPCPECLALHLRLTERAVAAGAPVLCVLPAFPAKSPNPRKTLGALPDMAEEQALRYLQRVCDEVQEVYQPGLEVKICSDGRVFSDLVGVADEDVTRYGHRIVDLIAQLRLRSLSSFNMEDLFQVTTFEGMRDHLRIHYAEDLDVVRERARSSSVHMQMWNGIQRFLFEDAAAMQDGRSRTQIRNECKMRAYEVVQRSNAWTRLVAECFPDALRLSIHPQPPHSEKVGILLGASADSWLTPWHGVALHQDGRWRFVKRAEAEALGAVLVERDGRPSHFEARRMAISSYQT